MKIKGNTTLIVVIIVFLAGLCLLLYPSAANYWNGRHQTRAIVTYEEHLAGLDEQTCQEVLSAAAAYNAELAARGTSFMLPDAQRERYEQLLNVDTTEIMGYVDIPEIRVSLPIYHGVSEGVLQIGAGHLEWSSLPVGGPSTHCVISGHRGLPSAMLFTDLDKVVEGDVFTLNVLNQVLTYEVDQILIVEPEDMDALRIVPGEDYCTLVTCTPYGVNTHRLLVRGHRVENGTGGERVAADAVRIEPLAVAGSVAVPLLVLLVLLALFLPNRKKKKDLGE